MALGLRHAGGRVHGSEAARLYGQVEPLYRDLHCYARGRLAKKYGEDKVPAGKPIPAHLLGNMWAQQWDAIYDLLEPYPGVSDLDVDAALEKQGYDAVRMMKSAETFYQSIAFPKLPETFWERSMLTRPRDRDVQCHPSAWHMDGKQDVRIKMCTRPIYDDLRTIYHELGHVYYYLWYQDQPFIFQTGAHDGFHEAVGDTVNLSMTPAYLAEIGLVPPVKPSPQAVINQQMKMALEKIAFLPFGKMIDEWRWQVFSGEVKPADYNAAWWALREKYQGVAPPVAAHRGRLRPGRQVPHPGQLSVHAVLPVVHPPVPVPAGAVRRGGLQGPARGVLDLRQRGGRPEVRRDARQGREPAVAGHAVRTDRHARDGCLGDPGVLRAAQDLARAAERGTGLRLVGCGNFRQRRIP